MKQISDKRHEQLVLKEKLLHELVAWVKSKNMWKTFTEERINLADNEDQEKEESTATQDPQPPAQEGRQGDQ